MREREGGGGQGGSGAFTSREEGALEGRGQRAEEGRYLTHELTGAALWGGHSEEGPGQADSGGRTHSLVAAAGTTDSGGRGRKLGTRMEVTALVQAGGDGAGSGV